MAFSVYLPTYLKTAYSLSWADGAANRMGGFVVVAVIMRPIGGWLSDRIGPVRVLVPGVRGGDRRGCRRRPAPRSVEPVGAFAFLAMAAALGAGSGATFALIAKVTELARVGGVTGLVGAAGGSGVRPAARDGLHLRTNGLLRDRPGACSR